MSKPKKIEGENNMLFQERPSFKESDEGKTESESVANTPVSVDTDEVAVDLDEELLSGMENVGAENSGKESKWLKDRAESVSEDIKERKEEAHRKIKDIFVKLYVPRYLAETSGSYNAKKNTAMEKFRSNEKYLLNGVGSPYESLIAEYEKGGSAEWDKKIEVVTSKLIDKKEYKPFAFHPKEADTHGSRYDVASTEEKRSKKRRRKKKAPKAPAKKVELTNEDMAKVVRKEGADAGRVAIEEDLDTPFPIDGDDIESDENYENKINEIIENLEDLKYNEKEYIAELYNSFNQEKSTTLTYLKYKITGKVDDVPRISFDEFEKYVKSMNLEKSFKKSKKLALKYLEKGDDTHTDINRMRRVAEYGITGFEYDDKRGRSKMRKSAAYKEKYKD